MNKFNKDLLIGLLTGVAIYCLSLKIGHEKTSTLTFTIISTVVATWISHKYL